MFNEKCLTNLNSNMLSDFSSDSGKTMSLIPLFSSIGGIGGIYVGISIVGIATFFYEMAVL